jgi:hypothetical protein
MFNLALQNSGNLQDLRTIFDCQWPAKLTCTYLCFFQQSQSFCPDGSKNIRGGQEFFRNFGKNVTICEKAFCC